MNVAAERQTPAQVAGNLWQARYSSARLLFCAGSVVRGEGYPHSDLDVIVLFDRLETAFRESFWFEGWPVEVFGHDPETLLYFAKQDCDRGRPSLPQMIAEALCIPNSTPYSDKIQAWARATLAKQPGPPAVASLAEDRYFIGDALNDLRDERSPAELRAIACQLYPLVCNFVLRTRGVWLGSGKTLPRLVERAAPDVHVALEQAFQTFFQTGERAGLLKCVEDILLPFGGEIFEGFYSAAPQTSRIVGGIPGASLAAGMLPREPLK